MELEVLVKKIIQCAYNVRLQLSAGFLLFLCLLINQSN